MYTSGYANVHSTQRISHITGNQDLKLIVYDVYEDGIIGNGLIKLLTRQGQEDL